MEYISFMLHNFRNIPQLKFVSPEIVDAIEVVGSVLPFKTNNYVVDKLINWKNVPDDPMFKLTFPQKEMLVPGDYNSIKTLIDSGADKKRIKDAANEIRLRLNPHPAGQIEYNVPEIDGEKLYGMQHKYRETVLFFPSQGQTCHAYCTFCFRWPQFVGMEDLKFASKEAELLVKYIKTHPEVTDVLFTGGDPLIMKTKYLETYIRSLLDADLPNLRHIRIGSKALAYWPYRFLSDNDADELLKLFEEVNRRGIHLAFMAHFNHPAELEGDAVALAINKIIKTGTVIRTQSPILKHINDSAETWTEMLKKQVSLGCIPYYMFVARNTGAQQYFSVPLIKAWELFRQTYQNVSGVCRTLRGPSMSCLPGKVQILGVGNIKDEKVLTFRMIQGRNPDWVARPFFANYDENAVWYTDLIPAFNEENFFFTEELNAMRSVPELETD